MPNPATCTKSDFVFSVYLAVVIFVLTQGPVYRLAFSDLQGSLKPDALTVAFSVFVMAQMPAILLFYRSTPLSNLLPDRDAWWLIAVVSIAALSTAWSTARGATVTASAAFAVTVFAAIAIAVRATARQLMWSVLCGVQPGLVISLFAVRRHWSGALEPKSSLEPWITTNNWVGIYGNRNSLAPVAAVGVLTCVFASWELIRNRKPLAIVGSIAVISVGFLDCLILIRSGSATLVFSMLIAAIAFCLSAVCHRVVRFRQSRSGMALRSILFLGVGTLVGSYALRLASIKYDRLSGFDGRTTFWGASFDAWRTRPVFGWGFMALWNTDSFRRTLPTSISDATWGHSSYLDFLAGGGLLLAVPVGAIMGVLLWRVFAIHIHEVHDIWMAIVAVTIIVAATQESFLLGSHFFLLLLVVTGMKLRPPSRLSRKKS
jgi:O-antigen ligase